ncbi:hypothetical protein V1477_002634 [Vespula maculifrons]|uniref:Uncharacterized protein n=1 Tax=Vespula maculifrons TaxID=7453 RepID=A0ABD2CWJ2_VESMC
MGRVFVRATPDVNVGRVKRYSWMICAAGRSEKENFIPRRTFRVPVSECSVLACKIYGNGVNAGGHRRTLVYPITQ